MTIRFIKLLVIYGLLLSSSFSFGIDDFSVKIKQVSSSGKTISVDTGSAGNIVDNDYGVLVMKKEYKGIKDAVYKPVAKLRAIKVYSNNSIWVIYQNFIPGEIKAGKRLFLFSETAFLKGRRKELEIKRTKLVTKSGESKEVKDFLLEGDDLAKKKEDYIVLEKPHEKEVHFEKEVDLIDVDKWDENSSDGKLYAHGIYRSPYAKEFSERKKVHTFEKMVVAFLNKYNDPNFDYDTFYEEQARKEGASDEFQDKNLYLSYLDRYRKVVHNRAQKEEKFLQQVQEKGEAWSEDYSDEELSEVLNNLSITRERQRRKKLLAFKYNYQLYGSVNANMLNNENTNDAKTTEQNKYDIEVAWEGYLFKKLQALQSFTIEASLRRSQDGFYSGDVNVRSTEYSVAAHVNWYPYHTPSMVDVNIPYIGLLFRYGFARLSTNSFAELGNYQVVGLPGVRGGLKYNFKNSYGIRLTGSFERLRVERIVRDSDGGQLPNRAHYLEAKIGVGLSKFF